MFNFDIKVGEEKFWVRGSTSERKKKIINKSKGEGRTFLIFFNQGWNFSKEYAEIIFC